MLLFSASIPHTLDEHLNGGAKNSVLITSDNQQNKITIQIPLNPQDTDHVTKKEEP